MLFRMYSVESPRTPPPSRESRHSPVVSRGFDSPPRLVDVVCSISRSALEVALARITRGDKNERFATSCVHAAGPSEYKQAEGWASARRRGGRKADARESEELHVLASRSR